MIGFHLQATVDDWPHAAARLPDGSPMKFTDGGPQRAVECKLINKSIYTAVRYVVQDQNPQGDFHQHARDFFSMFVDETFRKLAWAVDAVFEYNEYYAVSQDKAERDKWIRWTSACVDVWRDDYRTQEEYEHIELIVAEAPVGNDIPWEVARLSHLNHWVLLGYHPYVPVWKGQIRPDEWIHYSGRWEAMDISYRARGYQVRWYFGEFGAIGHNGPGWPNSLACNDGWRHRDVYNGNLDDYIHMMRYWLDKASETFAWRTGRIVGAVIFTSGGGVRWRHFELNQPDMNVVADAINETLNNIPIPPPPPKPPTPPSPSHRGEPRLQYSRSYLCVPQDVSLSTWLAVCESAYDRKQTVGFSYDDAGIGDLDRREAILFGLSSSQYSVFLTWFRLNYPGVSVIFRDYPYAGME